MVAVLLVLAMAIFAFAACTPSAPAEAPSSGGTTTETPAAPPAEEGKTFKVGFSNASTGNPWRASMMDTIYHARDTYGDMLELVITDANDDVQKQLADCEDLLQQGIDALILSPAVSDALAPVVDMCNDKGIPIIVFDRIINNPNFTAYVATDNHEVSIPVAEKIMEVWPDGATIYYLSGIAGAGPDIERTEGIMQVWDGHPEYNIVGQTDAYWNEADGMTGAEDALQAHPKGTLDMLLCSDGNTSIGALRAVDAAGRFDDVRVVAFDAWRTDSLMNIKDERILPYTTMLGTYVGAVTVNTTMQILLGATITASDKYVRIPCPVITLDNVESFYDPNVAPTDYPWRPAYEMFMADNFYNQFTNPVK